MTYDNLLHNVDNRDSRYKDFLPLLLEHKNKIYGYILTLIPRPSVAGDIMQETVLVMWEKFHEFTPGSNFAAWGKAIALNKVRVYRHKSLKAPVCFDDNLFDSLCASSEKEDKTYKMDALKSCLKQLSKIEAKLIHLRFVDQLKMSEIARGWGKPSLVIYRQMAKILYVLRECIEKKAIQNGA